MKWLTVTLILALCSTLLADNDGGIPGGSGTITIRPANQNWKIDAGPGQEVSFSEYSTTLQGFFPVTPTFSLSLWAAQAGTYGDLDNLGSVLNLTAIDPQGESLNGLTDVQISSNFLLEQYNTVFSLKINLPSGKKELAAAEFYTSSLISNSIMRMRVPNFGQGLNISPGIIWAQPLHENVTMGLGASYQYKGPFNPAAFIPEVDPGDEILVTGGLDVRANSSTTISMDVIFTTYSKDNVEMIGDAFQSGDKMTYNLQLRKYFGFNELRVLARYRRQAQSVALADGSNPLVVDREIKLVPNYVEAQTSFNLRASSVTNINFALEGRFFENVERLQLSGGNIIGVGVMPSFKVSDMFTIPVHGKFLTGSGFRDDIKMTGWEAGLGLAINY